MIVKVINTITFGMSSFHGAATRFSTLDTMANIDTSFSNLKIAAEPQRQQQSAAYTPQYLDVDSHQGHIMYTGTNYDESPSKPTSGGLPDGVGGRQKHMGSMIADFDTSTNPNDYSHNRGNSGIVASSRSRRDGTIGTETRVGADEDHLNNFLNRETSIARRYQDITPSATAFDDAPVDNQRGASGVLLHPMPMLHHEARGSDYDPQNVPGHRRPRADFYPTTDRLAANPEHHTTAQQQQQTQQRPPCPMHARTLAPWMTQSQQPQQFNPTSTNGQR